MDLERLSDPFPADDVEWRVSRAGMGPKGLYCMVLAYITARAVQARLDEVCGADNWRLEEPRVLTVDGKSAFACGLSIRMNDLNQNEWVTKWDVCEPTNIEAAKGGWSGSMKRAGAQWGIGRYLYRLDEAFAETSETPVEGDRSWNYAKLSQQHGGGKYFWKAPSLPGWALPKEPEHEVSLENLNDLKRLWKNTIGEGATNPKDLREGFARFVTSVGGDFPSSDHTCWTTDVYDQCWNRLKEGGVVDGVSADVPFGE